MKITAFIWLEKVIQKLIWKHSVTTEEVRGLFLNSPRYHLVEKGHRKDENVYAAHGQDEGRYLICYFVRKIDNRAFILSARDMTRSEKKRYGRK